MEIVNSFEKLLLNLPFVFKSDSAQKMLVTIRTLNSQRKIKIESAQELDQRIKDIFKTEKYLLYRDFEKTSPISPQDVEENMTVFMSYDMGEIKEYKEEVKCTHSPEAVCPKCVNREEKEQIEEEKKKLHYMSYDSYIKSLEEKGMKKEELDYEIKACTDHPANQKCFKCMEKRITLQHQIYRYIDNVEFDTNEIIEDFFEKWRKTRRQRIGLLLGKYVKYDDVPLGKKAVVSAIWEIEQESFPDGAVLNDIPKKFIIDDLDIIGVIYTDLVFKDNENTSNKVIQGYIVSTSEIDFINTLKQKFKNNAFFGVCVSFNTEKFLMPEVFMVSDQYEAVRKAGALSLTTSPHYFKANREIVYQIRNEYDKVIEKVADPFVEVPYFVVTCDIGVKESPIFSHNTSIKNPTHRKLAAYFQSDFSFEKFKNFNILLSLEKFLPETQKDIIKAVVTNNQDLFNNLKEKDEFNAFVGELSKYDCKQWNCKTCTYLNDPFKSSCDICGVRKS